MIFNVQPQADGYFCLWDPEEIASPVIEWRAERSSEWQQHRPRHGGRTFVPAQSREPVVLRLMNGGAEKTSAEVTCRPSRERLRDLLPARVPYSKMRRFHSWRRFASFTAGRALGRIAPAGGELLAGQETANGVYLVDGEATLFSRAIGRELLEHPTHAPAVTRAAARRKLWRAPAVVRSASLDSLPAARALGEKFGAELKVVSVAPGLESRIISLRSPRPNGRTAIYHEGHTTSGIDGGWSTVEFLLERGWHVTCVDMLLCGSNLPDRSSRMTGHNDLWQMDPEDACAPLAAMVAPVRAVVDQLEREHAAAPVLIGRSGGGMMSYLYAALDPRVAGSVSLAGGVPLSQRLELSANDLGDYEQFAPDFFDIVRHEDLMVAAAERGLLLLYNTHDSDCFALPGDHRLGAYLRREALRHGGNLDVYIDGRHRGHSFGADGYIALARFLEPFGQSRP
jgi:pimeloyl-ACP methyl ester carboxylesterase